MSPKAGTRPLCILSTAPAGDSAGLLSAPPSPSLRDLPHFSGCSLPPGRAGQSRVRSTAPWAGPRPGCLVSGREAGSESLLPGGLHFLLPPHPPAPPSTACLQGQRRRPPTAPKCPLQSARLVQLAPGQLSPRTCLLMRRARLAGPCGPGGPARAGPERCWHSIVNMGQLRRGLRLHKGR